MAILYLVLVFVSLVEPRAQKTLEQAVLDTTEPVTRGVTTEFEPTSLADLLRVSDLVVRAKIADSSTSLSPDGTLIYTYSSLAVVETLIPQHAGAEEMPTPGMVAPAVIVRQIGGKLTIRGREVRVVDSSVPLLLPGVEYLLFLMKQDDHYTIAKGVGAFALKSGVLVPLTNGGTEVETKYRRRPVAEMVGDLGIEGR